MGTGNVNYRRSNITNNKRYVFLFPNEAIITDNLRVIIADDLPYKNWDQFCFIAAC